MVSRIPRESLTSMSKCSCTVDEHDPSCEIEWHAKLAFKDRGWPWAKKGLHEVR